MKMVSMKQLRENFAKIKRGLKRGQGYILLYRSHPLAKILPFNHKSNESYTASSKPVELELSDALSPTAYQQIKQEQLIYLVEEKQVLAEINPRLSGGKNQSVSEKINYVQKHAGSLSLGGLTPTEMKQLYEERTYSDLLP